MQLSETGKSKCRCFSKSRGNENRDIAAAFTERYNFQFSAPIQFCEEQKLSRSHLLKDEFLI